MIGTLHSLRIVWRLWRRNLTVTIVVVLTLGLAVGAVCTVFGALNTALLQELPFNRPHELVALFNTVSADSVLARLLGTPRLNFAYPTLNDIREQNHVFTDVAAYSTDSANFTSGVGMPERLQLQYVSQAYFSLLEVAPAWGRKFLPEEITSKAGPPVILSYGVWQRQFGGSPDVLGRVVRIDDSPFTIVGIMPAGFMGMHARHWGIRSSLIQSRLQPDLWTPFTAEMMAQASRDSRNCDLIARLKPGITIEQARAETKLIAGRLERQYVDNRGWGIEVVSLHEAQRGRYRAFLFILMGACALLLIVAVVNAANLLLEQALGRRSEMAVRMALGAGRGSVFRQLLIEGLSLSLLAGLLGLVLTEAGCRLLNAVLPSIIAGLPVVRIDGMVLGCALLVTAGVGIVFGFAPLLPVSGNQPYSFLKAGRSLSVHSGRRLGAQCLVAGQITLTVVLLIGAGLLLRTFLHLSHVDPGCDTERVLTLQLDLSPGVDPQKRAAFYRQVLERVSVLPGVQSAGLMGALPVSGETNTEVIGIEGRSEPESKSVWVYVAPVSSGCFSTLGIPLRSGRFFTERDSDGPLRVTIINETLANRFWKAQDPIGRSIRYHGKPLTIVGVVGDVRQDGLDREFRPGVYLPHEQLPPSSSTLTLRTATSPTDLANTVRKTIYSIDPAQAVSRVRSMEKVIAEGLLPARLMLLLLSAIAAMAAFLALLGVYALLSYSVTRSRRELAVRVALGARSLDILKKVLRQGILLTIAGQATGLLLSLGVTRFLGSQLYGVGPTDRLTFVSVSVALLATALLACLIPARKATRVDPLAALKCD